MKFINFMLLFISILFIIGLGIDMEVARRDYIDAKRMGEKEITGCIFNIVCDKYNKLLERK